MYSVQCTVYSVQCTLIFCLEAVKCILCKGYTNIFILYSGLGWNRNWIEIILKLFVNYRSIEPSITENQLTPPLQNTTAAAATRRHKSSR